MFRFKTYKEQMIEERRKREAMQARQASMEAVSSIAFVSLAETGTINEATAAEHTELFSTWAENVFYKVGNIRSHEENLYRCLQAHTSQGDWRPDVSPSLWVKIGNPAEDFPEWSQPIGAHDAYNKGDKVSCAGKHWESDVDGNVWKPDVYGWSEVI